MTAQLQLLPVLPPRSFDAVGLCIYCGGDKNLSTEHIIPYSAGGTWTLPKSSCTQCATTTGRFEGEFSRSVLGPLRMLYNMPTRRPKERPRHLPLKVKYPGSLDWEIAYVDRDICPFLITVPLYPPPSALSGSTDHDGDTSATSKFWLRGGGFWKDRDAHLQWLCEALGAVEVMPTGTVNTETFCLTIAKVAHSYAVAELGADTFDPLVGEIIATAKFSSRGRYLGGGIGDEAPSANLHEVAIIQDAPDNLIVIRVRLFAILGMPTYHVVVGRVL